MGSVASILEGNNVISQGQELENGTTEATNTSTHQEKDNVVLYATYKTTRINPNIPCVFDVHGSSAGDVVDEVLSFAAARFYECVVGNATMHVDELHGFLVVIFAYCGHFNGKRLSSATAMILVGGLMPAIYESGVQYIGWHQVSSLITDILDKLFM